MSKKLFLFLMLYASIVMGQTDTSFYSIVSKGKIKGGQSVWQSSVNEFHFSYAFNDRGRGDSVETIVTTTESGNILAVKSSGVDYYKNPYSEIFRVKGDSAIWEINNDRKAMLFSNRFYMISDAGEAVRELLVRWVLSKPGKKSGVIPEGIVRADEPLRKNIAFNGKIISLNLIALYFEPTPAPYYLWFTHDLHFFASASSWSTTIKKGYESLEDTLFLLQEVESQSYFENEVKNNSLQLPPRLVFKSADVFQSSTASVKKGMDVIVENGKISSILPAGNSILQRTDSVIDCRGKFLMPGLWDMHGHFGKEEGAMYLAGGVTHLRDMGNDKIVQVYQKQIRENKLLGPDISYLSGFIDKADPFQGPTGKIILSLDEGLLAIDDYHRLGYNQIKLYSAIKPEWVAPLAERAHKYGMHLCGHIPSHMTTEQAIMAGYDEITHMNFILLNFMSDTIDTRTPARFRCVGDEGGKIDIQSKKVHDFIALMKKKNIALDATMNVWEGMFNEFKGDTNGYLKPIISWLPPAWRSEVSIQTPFANDIQRPSYESAYQTMMSMLKLLYENGILLVAGTDGGLANALHHELEIYVEAGIPANEALKTATYNAAFDCGLQDRYGDLIPGAEADLILIDGNPAEDISSIRRVNLVIKNNLIYHPKELLKAQGWSYYY